MVWLMEEDLKENKNQTSPPSPSFFMRSLWGKQKQKRKKKELNVKRADRSEQHV